MNNKYKYIYIFDLLLLIFEIKNSKLNFLINQQKSLLVGFYRIYLTIKYSSLSRKEF